MLDMRRSTDADLVTYDDNGNVIPLSQRFNDESDDIRYSSEEGKTKSARELCESDLRYLLEKTLQGKFDKDTYIPLRRNTPKFFIDVVGEHSRWETTVLDVPMVSTVKHIVQNMDDVELKYGDSEKRPHGLDVEDIISISKKMGDPQYIVLQNNGRYAEIVSFYSSKKNKKVVVAIDIAENGHNPKNYKYKDYLNGFNDGYYNVIVTEYEPDNLRRYLSQNMVIYDKQKMNGKYQVGSGRIVTLTHDNPFIDDSILEKNEKSQANSSDKRKSTESIKSEIIRRATEANKTDNPQETIMNDTVEELRSVINRSMGEKEVFEAAKFSFNALGLYNEIAVYGVYLIDIYHNLI